MRIYRGCSDDLIAVPVLVSLRRWSAGVAIDLSNPSGYLKQTCGIHRLFLTLPGLTWCGPQLPEKHQQEYESRQASLGSIVALEVVLVAGG